MPIPGLNLEDAPKSKDCRNLQRQALAISEEVEKCEEEMYDLIEALDVIHKAEQNIMSYTKQSKTLCHPQSRAKHHYVIHKAEQKIMMSHTLSLSLP